MHVRHGHAQLYTDTARPAVQPPGGNCLVDGIIALGRGYGCTYGLYVSHKSHEAIGDHAVMTESCTFYPTYMRTAAAETELDIM